jgi:hypothetical protein
MGVNTVMQVNSIMNRLSELGGFFYFAVNGACIIEMCGGNQETVITLFTI